MGCFTLIRPSEVNGDANAMLNFARNRSDEEF